MPRLPAPSPTLRPDPVLLLLGWIVPVSSVSSSHSITVPVGCRKRALIRTGYSGDSSCVPKPPRERGITHQPLSCVTSGDTGLCVPSQLPGALVLDELWPLLPGSDREHETPVQAASIPLRLCLVGCAGLCHGWRSSVPGLSCLTPVQPWHPYPRANTLEPSCSLGRTQRHSHTHRAKPHCSLVHAHTHALTHIHTQREPHCSPGHTLADTHTDAHTHVCRKSYCSLVHTHTLTLTHSHTCTHPPLPRSHTPHPHTHLWGPSGRPGPGQP